MNQLFENNFYTNANFNEMSWHDCTLYSMSFDTKNFQLIFDIDYIQKWIQKEDHFEFWVAPATLTFENFSDLKLDVFLSDTNEFIIYDLERENKGKTPNGKFTEWFYSFKNEYGSISFLATGFTQKIRKRPILSNSQEYIGESRW